MRDSSRLALRPPDGVGFLESMVGQVLSAADAGTPESTSLKDAGYWNKWKTYCKLMGTPCERKHGPVDR